MGAFTRGELITASKMNTWNSGATIEFSMPAGADYPQNYIGNGGCFYCHRVSGRTMLFIASITCGWFGGGNAVLEMWVNGAWTTLKSWSWGWNTSTSIKEESRGPGYYRFRSTDTWELDAVSGKIYCGDINCTTGGKIRCTDVWTANNGGYISGGLITADLANTYYRICQDGH